MNKIEIYTDGSCKPSNPGPAGFGVAVVIDGVLNDTMSVYIGDATNNIAELMAVEGALIWLEKNDRTWDAATVYTDSQYAIGLFTKNWKAKKNKELVARIRATLENFPNLNFSWVKGHDGNKFNELADELANQAVDNKELVREEKSVEKSEYCCENMKQQLTYDCPEHKDNCPDRIVVVGSNQSFDDDWPTDRLFLVGRNATSYDILFCPWCGDKIQESLYE